MVGGGVAKLAVVYLEDDVGGSPRGYGTKFTFCSLWVWYTFHRGRSCQNSFSSCSDNTENSENTLPINSIPRRVEFFQNVVHAGVVELGLVEVGSRKCRVKLIGLLGWRWTTRLV